MCVVYSLIIHFGITKCEVSLTVDMDLLPVYMYQLSALPPKQHTIPLIVSRQIRIANVSPNLTDALISWDIRKVIFNIEIVSKTFACDISTVEMPEMELFESGALARYINLAVKTYIK